MGLIGEISATYIYEANCTLKVLFSPSTINLHSFKSNQSTLTLFTNLFNLFNLPNPTYSLSKSPVQTSKPSICNSNSSLLSSPPWPLPHLPHRKYRSTRDEFYFGVDSIYSTVTVYACATSTSAAPTVKSIASTGVSTAPTSTGSPISFAGAASMNGASVLGMIVAGGVAIVSSILECG